MKSVMVSLTLVGVCFSARMYSMGEHNKTAAEESLLKAQKSYNKGQKFLSGMEMSLAVIYFGNQENYSMHAATEGSKANDYFRKSRCHIQCILNDKSANDVTKKSALDLGKKIDGISRANK